MERRIMIDQDKRDVMTMCRDRSFQGEITFPEVVHRLGEIGVERYHADFIRDEYTYYMMDGESLAENVNWPRVSIPKSFDAVEVETAIRSIQRGEIVYDEFLRRIMTAGCVGYFVQIAGRRALYFGRDGDIHLEPFPTPAAGT
jgi:uncharacterized protein YbcV (DUF1398 family)